MTVTATYLYDGRLSGQMLRDACPYVCEVLAPNTPVVVHEVRLFGIRYVVGVEFRIVHVTTIDAAHERQGKLLHRSRLSATLRPSHRGQWLISTIKEWYCYVLTTGGACDTVQDRGCR